MKASILRPGILVSLKTSLDGGVFYQRKDLTPDDDETALGEDVAKWETTRKIEDPAEHKRAVTARGAASSAIRSACAHTAFGLLCSEQREADLDEAIKKAHDIIDQFNRTAKGTQIHVYVIKGRIAATDQEAAQGIASEVRSMLDEMANGVRAIDVDAIRAAANRAKKIASLLSEEQGKKVSAAIQAARDAAREITKRVEKEGVEALKVAADIRLELGVINTARMAFLDFDDAVKIEGEEMPAVNVQRFSEVEVG